MATERDNRDHIAEGKASYQRWANDLLATEEGRQLYEEEAAKKELWLQLVEARQELGLTQDEVAKRLGVSKAWVVRIEKYGYEDCTLGTLRRYVQALDGDFSLEVRVRRIRSQERAIAVGE